MSDPMVGWTPPSWWYVTEKPQQDAQFLENLTRCIFQAGLNWQVVTNKWPGFKAAFHDFDVPTVAAYREAAIARLTTDAEIIRNKRKIAATIRNAQEFTYIARDHGSFRRWLDHLDKGDNYAGVVSRLIQRFNHVGAVTAHTFLHSVGEAIAYDDAVYGHVH
jgi:DNA-3-methyladenine glycosylase I